MSLFPSPRTTMRGPSKQIATKPEDARLRSDLFDIPKEVLAATAEELLAAGWNIERHLIPADFRTRPRPMSSAEKKWLRKPLDPTEAM